MNRGLSIDSETLRYLEREFVGRFRRELLRRSEDLARSEDATEVDRRHVVVAAEHMGFGLAEEA